jgi:hypothetical protein
MSERCSEWITGFLHTLSPSYLLTLLTSILNSLDSLSLPLTSFQSSDLISDLDPHVFSHKPSIFHSILQIFTLPNPDSSLSLLTSKIIREIGVLLLRLSPQPLTTSSLLNIWIQSVPSSLTIQSIPSISLLYGNALISSSSTLEPASMSFLSPNSLPPTPQARMQHLFALKPIWEEGEIVPFLESMTVLGFGEEGTRGDRSKVDGWLGKWGRRRDGNWGIK